VLLTFLVSVVSRHQELAKEARMNSAFLLAMGHWLAMHSADPVDVITSDHAPVLTGEIILQRVSYCDHVVVQTDRGFAFLEVDAGLIAVASGRWVTGRLNARGPQMIDIDGRVLLSVRIVAWDTDLSQARARFNRYCDPAWLDLGPDESG